MHVEPELPFADGYLIYVPEESIATGTRLRFVLGHDLGQVRCTLREFPTRRHSGFLMRVAETLSEGALLTV